MGGAETSLRELLAAVRAAEPDWEIWLVLGEDGPLAGIARELGVQVAVLAFPAALARIGDSGKSKWQALWSLAQATPAALSYVRRLGRHLRALRPDIIHTNGFKMHLLGSWVCPPETQLVWHIHDYVSARALMSRLLRNRAHRCAGAIANSHSVAADLAQVAPGLKVSVLYNAIDLTRFAPEGESCALDAAAGLPPAEAGTVRVGLVGTFARWKGHKVFLQALSRLGPERAIRGYIIGAPIYQTSGSQWSLDELKQTANALGLSERVGFTGFLEDPARAMRALDIVVHASTQPEPFGMVVIEGMACGKAVIASAAGGATELFEENRDAVSHQPGDAAGLAEQIGRLAADPALRRRLGKAGRVTAERMFHGKRLSGKLLAIYGEILPPGSHRTGPALKDENEPCALV